MSGRPGGGPPMRRGMGPGGMMGGMPAEKSKNFRASFGRLLARLRPEAPLIALVFVLGSGTRNIYIAITLVGWVSYTRIIRGEVLVAKRRDYVLAARAGGLSDFRILFRHLLPNVITQAIVFAMSDIVLDILAIVTLGYLGLGVQPPTPDWGTMIAEGQTFLTTHWELSTIPGVAVVVTALGLSLLADGLADLLRPE